MARTAGEMPVPPTPSTRDAPQETVRRGLQRNLRAGPVDIGALDQHRDSLERRQDPMRNTSHVEPACCALGPVGVMLPVSMCSVP